MKSENGKQPSGGSSGDATALLDAATRAEKIANDILPADHYKEIALDVAALRLLASHARTSNAELDAWKRLALAALCNQNLPGSEIEVKAALDALHAMGVDTGPAYARVTARAFVRERIEELR